MNRRGRPSGSLGPFTLAALDLASRRPVTYRDVQCELGMSREHAQSAVYSLKRMGLAVAVGTVSVPGAVRPAVQIRAVADQPSEPRIDELLATASILVL